MNFHMGTTIKSLRLAASMTQEQLAGRLGVSAQAVKERVMRRKERRRASVFFMIASLFDVLQIHFNTKDKRNQGDKHKNHRKRKNLLTNGKGCAIILVMLTLC